MRIFQHTRAFSRTSPNLAAVLVPQCTKSGAQRCVHGRHNLDHGSLGLRLGLWEWPQSRLRLRLKILRRVPGCSFRTLPHFALRSGIAFSTHQVQASPSTLKMNPDFYGDRGSRLPPFCFTSSSVGRFQICESPLCRHLVTGWPRTLQSITDSSAACAKRLSVTLQSGFVLRALESQD